MKILSNLIFRSSENMRFVTFGQPPLTNWNKNAVKACNRNIDYSIFKLI